MPTIGTPELLFILGLIVLLFGASRLPRLGRDLGQGIRNFRDSIKLLQENDPTAEFEKSAKASKKR